MASESRGRLSIAEKIAKAEEIKTHGNNFFKQQEYKKAIVSYSKVFAYVNGLPIPGDSMSPYTGALGLEVPTQEETASINALKVLCWSNIAMCHLKNEAPAKALEMCARVLEIDSNHVKARFRQGQALMQLKQYDQAKVSFMKALENDPNNSSIRTELKKIQDIHRCQNAKARKTFTNMFQKLGDNLY